MCVGAVVFVIVCCLVSVCRCGRLLVIAGLCLQLLVCVWLGVACVFVVGVCMFVVFVVVLGL